MPVLHKNKGSSICSSCQLGKSHKLPFIFSNNISTAQLEIVHSVIWGPAPVISYRFCIHFIDDYSKFSWIFPLSHKSDAHFVFEKFKLQVENLLVKKIKMLQNGSSEGKNHHIVDTGHALLAHASMPMTYWDEAFQTVVFLINRMPSLNTTNISPFERLFHQPPNYLILRNFRSLRYPFLRPYNKTKLNFRSGKCIFLGYNSSHRGYMCFH